MTQASRTLPAFDLKALEDESAAGVSIETSSSLLGALKRALREDGLLYLTNTGFDIDALAAEVRAVTDPVMNLPDEEAKSLMSTGFPPNGLTREGAESTAAVVGKGSYSDLCAKWTFAGGDQNVLPPDEARSFEKAWTAAHSAWDDICIRLLNLIGQVLGLADTPTWKAMMQDGKRDAILRFLRYPDVPKERAADLAEQPERMAPHHDLDVITLLHQTPCANGFVSLQGLFDGEWVGVPAAPQMLVVNFGEALSILSAGAVKATTHRVLSPSATELDGSARQSLVMFWQPPADFKLKPLDDSNFGEYSYGADGMPFGEWLGNAVQKLQEQNAASSAPAA